MLNFQIKQNTLKAFKMVELKGFANNMPTVISFPVQANLVLFSKLATCSLYRCNTGFLALSKGGGGKVLEIIWLMGIPRKNSLCMLL